MRWRWGRSCKPSVTNRVWAKVPTGVCANWRANDTAPEMGRLNQVYWRITQGNMTELTLAKAQAAVSGVLSFAREKSLAPMTVEFLDARGALKAFAAEDGTPLRRADIAIGKAHGGPGDGRELSRLASQSRTATVFHRGRYAGGWRFADTCAGR